MPVSNHRDIPYVRTFINLHGFIPSSEATNLTHWKLTAQLWKGGFGRQPLPVWVGHSCPTNVTICTESFLSEAAEAVRFTKSSVNGPGQECPTHTRRLHQSVL